MVRHGAAVTRVAILMALASASACRKGASGPEDRPPITAEWTDDFERNALGPDWYATSGAFELVNGALHAQGANNRPLWLRRALPRDAVIELDVWSNSPEGDIKLELYGDGRSYDPDKGSYLATSYVAVMGGWNNSKSILARLDEHGSDLATRTGPRVEPGRRYHWRFERAGARLTWFVDDMSTPFLEWTDPSPLEGAEHQYLAINNWQSDTWFDNLRVAPLNAE
jgi:hypothetical protein